MTTSKHLRIHVVRLSLAFMLLSLALIGCVTPRTRAVEQDIGAGYRLGLTVDEELRVVAIDAGGAATTAGVELGDQLVDLTWILSEAPDEVERAAAASTGEVITATGTPLRPPPGVEHETVAFTEPDDIREMISYGLPLRLQVMRAGEIQVLTIVPTTPSEAADAPAEPERYF